MEFIIPSIFLGDPLRSEASNTGLPLIQFVYNGW